MKNTSEDKSKLQPYLLRLILILMVCALNQWTLAADWPRFLGPKGDSISTEKGINKDWTAKPPQELWRLPLTDEGFSGPAVVGKVLYIIDHKGEEDLVRAIDMESGKEKWHYAYPEKGDENHGFTRATPTIENGKVYTVSRTGLVHCLEAAAGAKVWQADVMKNHGGKPPEWGAAHSAYLDGDRLITIAAAQNKHVVALDKKTGRKIWSGGGTDIAGYATPVTAHFGDTKQYLIFTGKSLIGVKAQDGSLLWRYPWETRLDVNACSPIVVGENLVWIASGYRRGCALLQITGDKIEELWNSRRISPHWSSAVLMDGYLYTTTPPGYLVCVEAKTGQEKWRDRGRARGFEHGGLCAVDGTLIVIEGNTGNVVQVTLSPEAYRELGRINPLKSARCWVAPIVADKKLYVRSPKELVCLDIGE
jgi:outer membrane protein assembly factor BamB